MKIFQESERKSTGISSLKIGFNKVFGYYIDVTKTHLDKVPDYFIKKQTLVNNERYVTDELKEFEDWLEDMKNIKFFFSKEELDLINENILYKKTMVFILKKQLLDSIIHILKFPNNLKKIKLLIAFFLPKFILEKIKNF